MSLYQIPLIVFSTREFLSALTPPQPPPSREERGKSIGIDYPGWRQLRVTWVRTGQILLATLEILSIIFHHLPESTQSWITQTITVIRLSDVLPRLHTSPVQLLGALLWLVGARLRLTTFATLGRFFRFEISIQRAHKLITTGPYAYVRHPAYTALLLLSIGWSCYQFAPGSWLRESPIMQSWLGILLVAIYLGGGLLLVLVVTLGRMPQEDDMLHAVFGKEWEEWARQVPCRLIPGIY